MSPVKLNKSDESANRAYSVCLAMIVKNEASIIARCLASVYHMIDKWVIVDTGSTDKTIEIVKDFMHDKPGFLLSTGWIDFATSRNHAFELAQSLACDYTMIIDADETLENLDKSGLDHAISIHEADVYQITVKSQNQENDRVFLVRSSYPGRWRGAIHEDLEFHGNWVKLGGAFIRSYDDGARHRNPARTNDDLIVLFREIEKDPKNPRNYYYLGCTYWCAKAYEQAVKAFELRVRMGGDPQEIAHSLEYLKAYEERANHGTSSQATA